MNLGSFGLYVIHQPFYIGAKSTGWKLGGIWYLFHDSLLGEKIITTLTGSPSCPLNFVPLDGWRMVKIVQGTLDIWPNICQYIDGVMKQSKSKQPSNSSYGTIQNAIQDPLTIPKLHVFMFIARILKTFLLKYQMDETMIIFLGADLYDLCQKLLQKFIKKSVMENADIVYKLACVDVIDKKNHRSASHIDIGFVAKSLMTSLIKDSNSDTDQPLNSKWIA